MTVLTTQARYQYLTDGASNSFPFPAPFIDPTDIVVTVLDSAGNTVTTALNGGGPWGFTLDGVADAASGEYIAGANVVFGLTPAAGFTVTVYRDAPATQTMTLVSGGKFRAETVNTMADKRAMIEQFHRDWLERAIAAPTPDPPGAGNPSMLLPTVAGRAGGILGFDAAGRPAVGGNLDTLIALLADGWTPSLSGIDWVPSITGLRALTPPDSFAVVCLAGYYNAGDKAPVLYGYSTGDTRADDGGLVVRPNSVGGGLPGRWNLLTLGAAFNAQDWGADPSFAIASDTAFGNWFNALMTYKARGKIPAGHYKFAAPAYWNLDPVATKGVTIEGDGEQETLLDFTNVATSPNFLIGGSTDLFYFVLRGVGIVGNIAGTVLQLGHYTAPTTYPDPLNECQMDIWVSNADNTSAAVAIEVNYYLTSPFTKWVANTGGAGDPVRLRHAVGNCFFGSWSTGRSGVHYVDDGYNFGNIFFGLDIENITGNPVVCDSINAANETWVGGTMVWRNAADGGAMLLNSGNNNFRVIGTQPARYDAFSIYPLALGPKAAILLWDTYIAGTANFAALNIAPPPETPADAYVVPIIPDSGHSGGMLIQRLIASVPLPRWAVLADNSTETGGSAGSDFKITAFDDAGANPTDYLVIRRQTGVAEIHFGLAHQAGALLGLFGAVPIAQPSPSGTTPALATAGSGAPLLVDSEADGGIGTTKWSFFETVRQLKLLGILAS